MRGKVPKAEGGVSCAVRSIRRTTFGESRRTIAMSVTGPRFSQSTAKNELRWLPDFCSLPVVFAVMVVCELLVLVIVIAPTDESLPLLPRLATASAFVQWLGLVCVVSLCQL